MKQYIDNKLINSTWIVIVLYPSAVLLFITFLQEFDQVEALEFFFENLTFSLFFTSLIYLFSTKIRVPLLFILQIIISIKSIFSAVYYYLYLSFLSASSFFVIMETNASETEEFLQAFVDLRIIAMVVAFLLPIFFSYKIFKRDKGIGSLKVKLMLIIISFIAWTFFSSKNLMYVSALGYAEYEAQNEALKKSNISKKTGGFINVKHESPSKEIYVVIIGESTTSDHMGIYGYSRNTTPHLESIKEDISVFNNVISPHTHTIPVLSKILTTKNFEQPDTVSGSIIQLLNQANFTTYWVSNQRPVGRYENLVTLMAKASTHQEFINTDTEQRRTPLDIELLPEINKVLNKNEEKVVLFIHLLGTHTDYKRRYPEEYSKFADTPPALNHNSKKALRTINSYDNSVLYNDYVLKSIIDVIKEKNEKSFVLYLSDHGEDVYDVNNNAIHVEANASSPMFRIPFVLWASEKFISKTILDINTNRAYMTDDLFYSIAQLCDVSFEGNDSTRSIFSEHYKIRERKLLNGITYETLLDREKNK